MSSFCRSWVISSTMFVAGQRAWGVLHVGCCLSGSRAWGGECWQLFKEGGSLNSRVDKEGRRKGAVRRKERGRVRVADIDR